MSSITVMTVVQQRPERVWTDWNAPEHIKNWCFASADWGVGDVENDLRVGGRFKTHMMAKDGSAGFDFSGVYTIVDENTRLAYLLDTSDEDPEARKVDIRFEGVDGATKITETFDAETVNPEEMQRAGWQAILDNFKKYAESQP